MPGTSSSERPPGILRRMLTAKGRSLEITKAGWLFIVLTIAVGFAAINSGSNLLHLIFGAQIALIVVSGGLSEFRVRHARVSLRAAGRVHAGSEALFEVRITNRHRRQPLMALTVESDDVDTSRGTLDAVVAFGLPPGETLTLTTRGRCPRRGRHQLPAAVVATRFPFGLFVKRRFLATETSTLVFPGLLERSPALDRARDDAREGAIGRVTQGRSGDVYELREHREDSLPASVNWPASARLGRLVVCTYEDHAQRAMVLELAPGREGDPRFERAISEAATAIVASTQERNIELGLRYGERLLFPPSSGRSHADAMLGFLSTAGAAGEASS